MTAKSNGQVQGEEQSKGVANRTDKSNGQVQGEEQSKGVANRTDKSNGQVQGEEQSKGVANRTDKSNGQIQGGKHSKGVANKTEPKLVDDDFDLSSLRLSQDFGADLGVKKLLTTVPVRKPNPQDFFRVHPEESWRLQTALLELKQEREVYLVAPSLWSELLGETKKMIIFAVINRQGIIQLWPAKLPSEDGRHDSWSRSALEAADIATKRWIRLKANMPLGAYEVYEATGELSEPSWPEMGFDALVKIAFKDHFISGLDHPAVRRLRGEL